MERYAIFTGQEIQEFKIVNFPKTDTQIQYNTSQKSCTFFFFGTNG